MLKYETPTNKVSPSPKLFRERVYDREFYDVMDAAGDASARQIVPEVNRLICPKSVINVGCGTGTWLSVFKENGIERVKGIDGDFVQEDQLQIPLAEFERVNLAKPFLLSGKFDLAICLEVAEHLPRNMASDLVREITKISQVVLFSAAVPGQGGKFHVNEQWHCFWHDRFMQREFHKFDFLRPMFASNEKVAWWYRQNMFLYVHKDSAVFNSFSRMQRPSSVEIVALHVLGQQMSVSGLLRALPPAILRTMRNRFTS